MSDICCYVCRMMIFTSICPLYPPPPPSTSSPSLPPPPLPPPLLYLSFPTSFILYLLPSLPPSLPLSFFSTSFLLYLLFPSLHHHVKLDTSAIQLFSNWVPFWALRRSSTPSVSYAVCIPYTHHRIDWAT